MSKSKNQPKSWKLVIPEKAPQMVMVYDETRKRAIYVGDNEGGDLETAYLTAAAPVLLEALKEINGLCANSSTPDGVKINVGQLAKISIAAINAATKK